MPGISPKSSRRWTGTVHTYPTRESGDLDSVEVAGHNLLSDVVDEGLGTRMVVVHSEAGAGLFTLAVHQTHGVGLAVDVNAHDERIGHGGPSV
jgi:hypothetical protein